MRFSGWSSVVCAFDFRYDLGAAAPVLGALLLVHLVEDVHLLEKVVVDEGALLQAAGHGFLPLAAARTAPAGDELLGRLGLVSSAAFGLAPGRHGVPAARGLALATAEGVVDREIGRAHV